MLLKRDEREAARKVSEEEREEDQTGLIDKREQRMGE